MSLELIIGCMFSGKTSELIRRIRRYESIGKNVCVINHSKDTRTDKKIKSHNNDSIISLKYEKLMNFVYSIKEPYDVICIDEAQFFDDLFVSVQTLVDVKRFHVIVAGLNGDYRRCNFGQIHELLPLADDIHHCKAFCGLCKDGKQLAIHTKRLSSGKDVVDVGAADKYVAVCRDCYFRR